MFGVHDFCAIDFGRQKREQQLGELVRVYDARFFLSKATVQTRQGSRLDSLAPEHVIRNPKPYQLFGQHTISVEGADRGSKLLPVQVRPDRHREFFNTTDFERVDNLDCRNHHAVLRGARVLARSESSSS